jgi:hypothetical protein
MKQNDNRSGRQQSFASVGDVLKEFKSDEDKYISHEFQKYGYSLAKELGDLKSKSLYIKLAKTTSRGFLETARNFVKDARNVESRARLFMWKLKQLKDEAKKKKSRKIRGK